jgi:hypothetical protein
MFKPSIGNSVKLSARGVRATLVPEVPRRTRTVRLK